MVYIKIYKTVRVIGGSEWTSVYLLLSDVPGSPFNRLRTPLLGDVAHSCVVSFYGFAGTRPDDILQFGVLSNESSPGPYTRKALAVLKGSDTKHGWTKVTTKIGNWVRGARVRGLVLS